MTGLAQLGFACDSVEQKQEVRVRRGRRARPHTSPARASAAPRTQQRFFAEGWRAAVRAAARARALRGAHALRAQATRHR